MRMPWNPAYAWTTVTRHPTRIPVRARWSPTLRTSLFTATVPSTPQITAAIDASGTKNRAERTTEAVASPLVERFTEIDTCRWFPNVSELYWSIVVASAASANTAVD